MVVSQVVIGVPERSECLNLSVKSGDNVGFMLEFSGLGVVFHLG